MARITNALPFAFEFPPAATALVVIDMQTTMRDANDRGYLGLLAEAATESYFPHFKQAVLDMVRAQGAIVGWTSTGQDITDALA